MSTWTAPITWANAAVTAAQMNAEIRDHLNFVKGALNLLTNSTVVDTGVTMQLRIERANSADAIIDGLVTSDTGTRFRLEVSGAHYWSSGTTTWDTKLSRVGGAPGQMQFDSNGTTNTTRLTVESTAGQRNFIDFRVNGDATSRALLGGDATLNGLEFGNGTAARDTNLYRTGVNYLKTDDQFIAADGIQTKIVAGVVSDGSFTATPGSGTIAIDTTNSRIYVRVGSTWKFVAVA